MSNLNYYDFMKVDIRVGTIVKAEEYNMLKKTFNYFRYLFWK